MTQADIDRIVAASQQRIDAKLAESVAKKLGIERALVRVTEHRPIPGKGSMTVPVFAIPESLRQTATGLGLTVVCRTCLDNKKVSLAAGGDPDKATESWCPDCCADESLEELERERAADDAMWEHRISVARGQ